MFDKGIPAWLPWNYKGAGYAALEQLEQSERMGFKNILARIDKVIQVDHGPVISRTQLFLTK